MSDFKIFETEYKTIHQQRVALVRIIHLWHQIGFPASAAVFAFFLHIGLSENSKFSLILGALFGSVLIYFTRYYTAKLDDSVVSLYRRIVTLEILLGFRFFRDYLLTRGESARKIIKQCDEVKFQTPEELSVKISSLFSPEYFPSVKRGYEVLDKAVWIIVISYWLISLYSISFLTPITS